MICEYIPNRVRYQTKMKGVLRYINSHFLAKMLAHKGFLRI
jgi:hypothetical protein